MDGEENYRRVVLSNTGEGEKDVGKPVSLCVDPVKGLVMRTCVFVSVYMLFGCMGMFVCAHAHFLRGVYSK